MSSIEVRVAGKYRVGALIARGSFCDIYAGRNVLSNIDVVIKAEPTKVSVPSLPREEAVLRALQGCLAIPTLHHFEKSKDYYFLVEDQLGLSLEDYFNQCGRKFSLKTVLMLAEQLLGTLEFIHSKGVLYRDLSSENLLMGLGKKNHLVFFTDFGLSVFEH
jgi:serine/threonine protein kinase